MGAEIAHVLEHDTAEVSTCSAPQCTVKPARCALRIWFRSLVEGAPLAPASAASASTCVQCSVLVAGRATARWSRSSTS
jgi:hypothetical protein